MERVLRLCHLAILLALVVVLLGAWTRINDAGLGCPDWPGCYGEWVLPTDTQQLASAQELYPEQPIVAAKGWLEMVHRYAAGTLGLLIAAIAWLTWQQRHRRGCPLKLSFGLLGLVIVQAVFGMWTVTLKLLPQVVTLHLLGGLLTLTLLLVLRYRLIHVKERYRLSSSNRQRLVAVGAMLLFTQIMLGGWTSSNYAGWACTDWLLCERNESVSFDYNGGFSLPAYTGQSHEGGLKDRESRAAIQVVHRFGAVMVSLYLLALCLILRKQTALLFPLSAIAIILIGQNVLGMLNVAWGLPRYMAIAHHGGAVALLVSLIWLYSRIGLLREGVRHA